MAESNPTPFETEVTDQGEQVLMPNTKPIQPCERLALMMSAPLAARREQKLLTIGLFDEDARNQLNLF